MEWDITLETHPPERQFYNATNTTEIINYTVDNNISSLSESPAINFPLEIIQPDTFGTCIKNSLIVSSTGSDYCTTEMQHLPTSSNHVFMIPKSDTCTANSSIKHYIMNDPEKPIEDKIGLSLPYLNSSSVSTNSLNPVEKDYIISEGVNPTDNLLFNNRQTMRIPTFLKLTETSPIVLGVENVMTQQQPLTVSSWDSNNQLQDQIVHQDHVPLLNNHPTLFIKETTIPSTNNYQSNQEDIHYHPLLSESSSMIKENCFKKELDFNQMTPINNLLSSSYLNQQQMPIASPMKQTFCRPDIPPVNGVSFGYDPETVNLSLNSIESTNPLNNSQSISSSVYPHIIDDKKMFNSSNNIQLDKSRLQFFNSAPMSHGLSAQAQKIVIGEDRSLIAMSPSLTEKNHYDSVPLCKIFNQNYQEYYKDNSVDTPEDLYLQNYTTHQLEKSLSSSSSSSSSSVISGPNQSYHIQNSNKPLQTTHVCTEPSIQDNHPKTTQRQSYTDSDKKHLSDIQLQCLNPTNVVINPKLNTHLTQLQEGYWETVTQQDPLSNSFLFNHSILKHQGCETTSSFHINNCTDNHNSNQYISQSHHVPKPVSYLGHHILQHSTSHPSSSSSTYSQELRENSYKEKDDRAYPSSRQEGQLGFQLISEDHSHHLSDEDSDIPSDVKSSLVISYIPKSWTLNRLKQTFAPYGQVLQYRLDTDPDTGNRKGRGFIQFDCPEAAKAAVKGVNGLLVEHNKRLKVQLKRFLSPRYRRAGRHHFIDNSNTIPYQSSYEHDVEQHNHNFNVSLNETTENELNCPIINTSIYQPSLKYVPQNETILCPTTTVPYHRGGESFEWLSSAIAMTVGNLEKRRVSERQKSIHSLHTKQHDLFLINKQFNDENDQQTQQWVSSESCQLGGSQHLHNLTDQQDEVVDITPGSETECMTPMSSIIRPRASSTNPRVIIDQEANGHKLFALHQAYNTLLLPVSRQQRSASEGCCESVEIEHQESDDKQKETIQINDYKLMSQPFGTSTPIGLISSPRDAMSYQEEDCYIDGLSGCYNVSSNNSGNIGRSIDHSDRSLSGNYPSGNDSQSLYHLNDEFLPNYNSPVMPQLSPSSSSSIIPDHNLFVFHIPPDWNEKEFQEQFSVFGKIRCFSFPKDNTTPWGHKGYGFICYEERQDACRAIEEMDGKEIEIGRRLKVEFKKPLNQKMRRLGPGNNIQTHHRKQRLSLRKRSFNITNHRLLNCDTNNAYGLDSNRLYHDDPGNGIHGGQNTTTTKPYMSSYNHNKRNNNYIDHPTPQQVKQNNPDIHFWHQNIHDYHPNQLSHESLPQSLHKDNETELLYVLKHNHTSTLQSPVQYLTNSNRVPLMNSSLNGHFLHHRPHDWGYTGSDYVIPSVNQQGIGIGTLPSYPIGQVPTYQSESSYPYPIPSQLYLQSNYPHPQYYQMNYQSDIGTEKPSHSRGEHAYDQSLLKTDDHLFIVDILGINSPQNKQELSPGKSSIVSPTPPDINVFPSLDDPLTLSSITGKTIKSINTKLPKLTQRERLGTNKSKLTPLEDLL